MLVLDLTDDQIDVIAANATADDIDFLRRQKRKVERAITFETARDDLLTFVRLMFPDPQDADDLERTLYDTQPHHRLIAEAMENVVKGKCKRLIVTMPPRRGKSELITRCGAAWAAGRHPWKQIILGGYAENFAKTEFGLKIKRLMTSERYQDVFPEVSFVGGSKATGDLMLTQGGQIMSRGRGGGTTGKGADLFIVDDPIKDAKEADSETIRKDVWDWFNTVASTRMMGAGAIIIIMTRWHEDDIVGRLTDRHHPEHNPEVAAQWTVLKLPELFEDEHSEVAAALGKEVGDVLWPARYPKADIEYIRLSSPRTFSALYQGDPTPPDGSLFQSEWLHTYTADQLPPIGELNIFAASDHAVSVRHHADPTVLGLVGVDNKDTIYVLPDLVWKKIHVDAMVEMMLKRMRDYKPRYWWMESENIAKAFGPFLRKRMMEERIYCPIISVNPHADKAARSSSIQGRMQQGKVLFPSFAPWWPQAKNQILRFPNATHDDFVDFISWIGIGLDSIYGSSHTPAVPVNVVQPGTMGWVRQQRELAKQRAGVTTTAQKYGEYDDRAA